MNVVMMKKQMIIHRLEVKLMNNQVYFEINGTAKSIADIPEVFQIVFLSKKSKKTKTGTKTEIKFYALSSTSRVALTNVELGSCRLRSAIPTVVREYFAAAVISNNYWRYEYDKESD
jgi:hypothetical protein